MLLLVEWSTEITLPHLRSRMSLDDSLEPVWNILHDGTIDAARGEIPGDVQLTISISYLCGMLPTKSDHLLVKLSTCTLARMELFSGATRQGLVAFGDGDTEILSAKAINGAVEVCCRQGMLTLQYRGVSARLTEGPTITLTELHAAAERYWSERAERGRGSTKGR